MPRTVIHHFGLSSMAPGAFGHGVSLHSHTSCSKESLEFIPKYARRSRFLGKIMDFAEWQYLSQTGNRLDCSRAYWTPPLSPKMALDLETRQIEKMLNLPALVSLTDHDNCEASAQIETPVSIEWTIPYAPSFFHLGVHNLPRTSARQIVADMNSQTANPTPSRLPELLGFLHTQQEILVVLNHPLWDEGLIGSAAHAALAEDFLARYGAFVHALELNGLRGAEENGRVLALANALDLPAISGGDRHGREPNANVNLTKAGNFVEFVQEIRRGQVSHVVYLSQYRETLRLRQFETAWDILRYDRHRLDDRNSGAIASSSRPKKEPPGPYRSSGASRRSRRIDLKVGGPVVQRPQVRDLRKHFVSRNQNCVHGDRVSCNQQVHAPQNLARPFLFCAQPPVSICLLAGPRKNLKP